jgi:hypothetical protein
MLNFVLSSLPIYYLSLFKIPKGILSKLDQIRKRFLWAGVDNVSKRKYHSARWDSLCLRKNFGGWSILNLTHMNVALIGKWWWKFVYKDCEGIWKVIISLKYPRGKKTHISPFWTGILQVFPLINSGIQRVMGNGEHISFWHDVWNGSTTIAYVFSSFVC